MKVFVSYSRADHHDEASLRELEDRVKTLFPDSTPYICDLRGGHHKRNQDVKRAFEECVQFVAVVSPRYRRTRWTRKEYRWAINRRMPIHLIQKQDLTALAA
ncbi:TIR domain-containing protein [Lentzea sp. NPDC004789]